MKNILIINGPNLNLLGNRENTIYGDDSLKSINKRISELGKELSVNTVFFQSNHEGEIIDKIHEVLENYDGCIINAGALTHYSYSILDAIKAVRKPFIEVHMSNIHKREEFRHISVISQACAGQICGFGANSYLLALRALCEII